MPRLCPTQTISHRLELGTYERKEFRKALKIYQREKRWENVPNYMLGGAGILAAGGLGWGLYKIGQGISMIDLPDLSLPDVTGWLTDDAPGLGPAATHEGGIAPIELLIGYPEYTNYNTGKVHKNKFYKWPVVGALYGAGINIGIASFNAASDLDTDKTIWENLFG